MKFVRVNTTDDGDNEIIAEADVPEDKRIRVLGYALTGLGTGVASVQSTESTPTIVASFEFSTVGAVSYAGTLESPAFDLPQGVGLEITNAAGVDALGHLTYEIV